MLCWIHQLHEWQFVAAHCCCCLCRTPCCCVVQRAKHTIEYGKAIQHLIVNSLRKGNGLPVRCVPARGVRVGYVAVPLRRLRLAVVLSKLSTTCAGGRNVYQKEGGPPAAVECDVARLELMPGRRLDELQEQKPPKNRPERQWGRSSDSVMYDASSDASCTKRCHNELLVKRAKQSDSSCIVCFSHTFSRPQRSASPSSTPTLTSSPMFSELALHSAESQCRRHSSRAPAFA